MEIPNWLTMQNISLCVMKEAAFQADIGKIQKGSTEIFLVSNEGKYLEELKMQGIENYKCGKSCLVPGKDRSWML